MDDREKDKSEIRRSFTKSTTNKPATHIHTFPGNPPYLPSVDSQNRHLVGHRRDLLCLTAIEAIEAVVFIEINF